MFIEYLLIARDSSIDIDKNTVSIFDVLEDLNIETETSQAVLPIQILGSIRRDKEKGAIEETAQLELSIPGRQPIIMPNVTVKLEPQHTRCRIRVSTQLPILGPGQYKVRLTVGDIEKEMLITVNYVRQSSAGQLPLAQKEA